MCVVNELCEAYQVDFHVFSHTWNISHTWTIDPGKEEP